MRVEKRPHWALEACIVRNSYGNMNYARRNKRVAYNRFAAFVRMGGPSLEIACGKWPPLTETETKEYVKIASDVGEGGHRRKAELEEKMASFNELGRLGRKSFTPCIRLRVLVKITFLATC